MDEHIHQLFSKWRLTAVLPRTREGAAKLRATELGRGCFLTLLPSHSPLARMRAPSKIKKTVLAKQGYDGEDAAKLQEEWNRCYPPPPLNRLTRSSTQERPCDDTDTNCK